MPPRPLLLIEVLEGLGAHDTDSRLRVRALRAAGWNSHAWVLTRPPGEPRAGEEPWPGLDRRLAESGAAEIWVASSRTCFEAVARAAGPARPPRWWPTLLPGSEPERASPAPGAVPVPIAATDDPAALELAVLRPPRPRPPVSLWDGDFALAPGPLDGGAGGALLEAFARAAEARPGLDLVVLADPQPEFVCAARALGVYARVHFAGEAPREAEHTWCATASAVLLPLGRPVCASLVLRVLAAGAPLVPVGEGAAFDTLTAWLARRTGCPPRPLDDALAAALEPDLPLRRAIARGRDLAAGHEPEALARRLPGPPSGEAREVA